MEQLGNLLTAMIAVVLSGQSDLLLGSQPQEKTKVFPDINPSLFRRGAKYYGIYHRVAEKLALSKPYVFDIGCGRRKSPRIVEALRAEMLVMDAEFVKRPSLLTAAEVRDLRRGGRYYGLAEHAARHLGLKREAVNYTIRSNGRSSQRILTALRAEMARVDSLPQEKRLEPLTDLEIAQFRKGRKYNGVFVRLNRTMGWTRRRLRDTTFRSENPSQERLKAVRAEMARIDAEIEAKKGRAS
jgi:hypothetical protein